MCVSFFMENRWSHQYQITQRWLYYLQEIPFIFRFQPPSNHCAVHHRQMLQKQTSPVAYCECPIRSPSRLLQAAGLIWCTGSPPLWFPYEITTSSRKKGLALVDFRLVGKKQRNAFLYADFFCLLLDVDAFDEVASSWRREARSDLECELQTYQLQRRRSFEMWNVEYVFVIEMIGTSIEMQSFLFWVSRSPRCTERQNSSLQNRILNRGPT